MAEAIVGYSEDLPEIPDRKPWEKPASYLVKDEDAQTGWREERSGRRPSQLLLPPKIRRAVDEWRDGGYEGAADVSRRLLQYWFEEDHEVRGFQAPFRYYFCQREAIETLIWLVEVARQTDCLELIREHATPSEEDRLFQNFRYHTRMDGLRFLTRTSPVHKGSVTQELPPEDLRRYAFKMATGSGKTWVMAMAIVWSRFHKLLVEGSDLSTNFLIVAPNVIVYQRLEKDFAHNRIFHELPLFPPEWRGRFTQKVILRGEAAEPDPSGNLFLTNIHQLYESRDEERESANPVEALLGTRPIKDLAASGRRSMLERVKSLDDLVVMNDEAHHVHSEELKWNQSLQGVHETLPRGIAAWLDFTATPKDRNGLYFPWTVVDYPLAQAVEDRIVKAPLIVNMQDELGEPPADPEKVTRSNVVEKYEYWLRAAVKRWQAHQDAYRKLQTRSVLFVMTLNNACADAIGEFFLNDKEFGFKKSEVLVIHTDSKGEITKKDLEKARQAARDIDEAGSRIKVIVSVMMLREGWDVRGVSIVLGLRPFTAKAEILPEQVIGRGLRLMTNVSPDRTQTLEVLGTRRLLDLLRRELEREGVGFAESSQDPPSTVVIGPVREKLKYDIVIPVTRPSLTRNCRKLSELNVDSFEAVAELDRAGGSQRINLKMDHAITETEVGRDDVELQPLMVQDALADVTNKVMDAARLTGCFADLLPIVREYVEKRCFGREVNLAEDWIRSHLSGSDSREAIAGLLARKIGELTVERRSIEFANAEHRLSETRPFIWRRNLPALEAEKTVFNFVATYNDYERSFAEFLNRADDVLRFASLATTEQGGAATTFRVDYLKSSGAVGFYYPDWAIVQASSDGEVNWIIETKGRIWPDTQAKDEAIRSWCLQVSSATCRPWRFARVNQGEISAFRLCSANLRTLTQLMNLMKYGLRDSG